MCQLSQLSHLALCLAQEPAVTLTDLELLWNKNQAPFCCCFIPPLQSAKVAVPGPGAPIGAESKNWTSRTEVGQWINQPNIGLATQNLN